MRNYKLLFIAFLLIVSGCSSDDDPVVENGVNHQPNLRSVGASAHDFLSLDQYTKLAIDIVYVTGYKPSDETIGNLQDFIEARLNKPGGVTITYTEIPPTGQSPFSISEITTLEATHRTKYNTPDTLALYIFFADGGSTSDTGNSFILGTAYRNTSCVMYESTIKNLTNILNRADLESIVLLHELGHLLGLVDLGSPMQTNHLDSSHGKHCSNPDCLMYWEVETSNIMTAVDNGIPPLDANCLADLAANGGK